MKYSVRFLIASFFIFVFSMAQAQDNYRSWFSYLSPVPGAQHIMPGQKISFRLPDNKTDQKSLLKTGVQLSGSRSGSISGTLNIASDGQTFIFSPSKNFTPGESVEVLISFDKSLDIQDFKYDFTITSLSKAERRSILNEILRQELPVLASAPADPERAGRGTVVNDSLPYGFPEITLVKSNHPSDGYIFISPLNYDDLAFYQIILDNHATPVYYRQVPAYGAMDFKLQPSGYLTTYLASEWKFIVQDDRFDVIDTIAAGNGYDADMHELRYYEDMHAFLLCYDPQLVDMSLIVPGGQPDAVVTGLIVQELDENNEVVFQWRSWDHYQITDASNWIDLTAGSIDYVHGNSIEIINDSVMMICSRNMNEITKLNRTTGDIIWRLNGENNMFDFIPPADSFCVQHSIRLMPDSANISIFDNGGCWVPQYSSAVEYILDEENLTATLVERLQSDPDIFGPYMGNTQRLLNGHTINGWGKGVPSVTEFDTSGAIVLELSFPQLNYRAFKFDWKHDVFTAGPEEIDFGTIDYHDSAFAMITLTNNYSTGFEINRILHQSEVFSVTSSLPVLLPQGGTAEVEVKFRPGNPGTFDDVVTLCWEVHSDTLRQRVAVQVKLKGTATGNDGVGDLEAGGFYLYPSPFKEVISIRSDRKFIRSVTFLTLGGKEVFKADKLKARSLDQPLNLPAGTYLVVIESEEGERYGGKIIKK